MPSTNDMGRMIVRDGPDRSTPPSTSASTSARPSSRELTSLPGTHGAQEIGQANASSIVPLQVVDKAARQEQPNARLRQRAHMGAAATSVAATVTTASKPHSKDRTQARINDQRSQMQVNSQTRPRTHTHTHAHAHPQYEHACTRTNRQRQMPPPRGTQRRRTRKQRHGGGRSKAPKKRSFRTSILTSLLLITVGFSGFTIIIYMQLEPTWRDHHIRVPTGMRWMRTLVRDALHLNPTADAYDEAVVPHTMFQHSRPVHRDFNRSNFVHRRLQLQVPLPIIVVGLPKAGTSSLFVYFDRVGLASQHWYCCDFQYEAQIGGPGLMSDCLAYNHYRKVYANDTSREFVSFRQGEVVVGTMHRRASSSSSPSSKERKDSIFQGCGDYDVFTEINGPRRIFNKLPDQSNIRESKLFIPQHFHLQELYDAYPEATWILNVRRGRATSAKMDENENGDLDTQVQQQRQRQEQQTATKQNREPTEESPSDYDAWSKSVQRHSPNLQLQFVNECLYQRRLGNFPSNIAINNTGAFLSEFAFRHTLKVRRFVQDHPTLSFLEVDINNSTGQLLTKFLFGSELATKPQKPMPMLANRSSNNRTSNTTNNNKHAIRYYADCWGQHNINHRTKTTAKDLQRNDADAAVAASIFEDDDERRKERRVNHSAAFRQWRQEHRKDLRHDQKAKRVAELMERQDRKQRITEGG